MLYKKDTKFELLFNESQHKYMDTFGNIYTSMTTVIGEYTPEFEKTKIAKAVSRKHDSKYFGWNVLDILKDWDKITKESHVIGNATHNKLEGITKSSTNHNYKSKAFDNYNTLYTVTDILEDSSLGELDVDKFLTSGIKEKYPRIYNLFIHLASLGYRFFSEIGVFNIEYLVSGLIDILCVHYELKQFIIVDWKTNKHDLVPNGVEENKYKSGYFKKDSLGNETHEFIFTNQNFKYPLHSFQTSHFLTYAFQLNGYAHLFSKFGFTLSQLILVHVRDRFKFTENDSICNLHPEYIGLSKVEFHMMPIYQDEVELLFKHHSNNKSNQLNLFQ